MDSKQPVYLIFEGGGAKGFAHIGALRAIEDCSLDPVGVAGASAGAIIAALVAVGYQSHEIINPNAPRDNLLSRYGLSPRKIIGAKDADFLQEVTANWKSILRRFLVFGGALHSFASAIYTLISIKAGFADILYRLMDFRGLVSTDNARDHLNFLLWVKLSENNPKLRAEYAEIPLVTFGMLKKHQNEIDSRCALTIIVSDIESRQGRIFDETTEHVVIADAVAASIALPVIFRPKQLPWNEGTIACVDGGMISNLPSWVFAEDKLRIERQHADRGPIPVVAFTLQEEKVPSKERGNAILMMHHFMNVVFTGVFGGQGIVQDFIPDLHVIPVRADIGTVDFFCSPERAAEVSNGGYHDARKILEYRFGRKREIVVSYLQKAHAEAKDYLGIWLRSVKPTLSKTTDVTFSGLTASKWDEAAWEEAWANAASAAALRLRCCIIKKFRKYDFRVALGFNMDGEADDRFIIDGRNSGAPRAFLNYEPQILTLGDEEKQYFTKYEERLRWSRLKTIIAIPILPNIKFWNEPITNWKDLCSEREPLAVLCFDSDEVFAVPPTGALRDEFITQFVSIARDFTWQVENDGGIRAPSIPDEEVAPYEWLAEI